MNWTLIFIDRETETCGIVEMKNPTQGQIEVYQNELLDRYPRSFGIRLIPNKKAEKTTIRETLPELEKFNFVKFEDFL